MKILIIEDNQGDIRLIQEMLNDIPNFDYNLDIVRDMEKGIKKIENNNLDIIFLDLGLYKTTGLNTLEKILKYDFDIPIVVLTGMNKKSIALKAVEKGAQDYLVKSDINSNVLNRVISYSIERNKYKNRIKQINRILDSIRKLNQMIIKVSNKKKLIENACEILFDNKEFYNVLLVLTNENQNIILKSEINYFKKYSRMDYFIKDNKLTEYAKNIINKDNKKLYKKKLSIEDNNYEEITIILKNENSIYGFLNILTKKGFIDQIKEKKLLLEMTADISFALKSIEYNNKRVEAEKNLKKSEERFRKLFDNSSNIAIQGYKPDGTIIYWNKASEKIYGYSKKEAIGENLLDLIIPEDIKSQVKKSIEKSIKTNEVIPASELRLKHKNGKLIDVYSSHTIVNYDNNEIELFCLDVDITKRKEAEREKQKLQSQLDRARKLESVGTLTGGIAHDINNMLTPIMGYAELLKDNLPEDSRLYGDVKQIKMASQKAKELIQQLLTFSRNSNTDLNRIDIVPNIKESLKLLRSSLPASIDIHQDIDTHVRKIMGNSAQIQQIIMNLCINASHAMENGKQNIKKGNIYIKLREVELDKKSSKRIIDMEDGNYIKLSITDDGKGMDDKTLSHIFEPFYTTKKEGQGTGMGLAVVHGIVKQYGGAIKVYSEPEKGTTFNIYIPVVESKEKKKEENQSIRLENSDESIFIVDDRQYVTKMLKEMLSSYGYKVTCINDSQKAFEKLKEDSRKYNLLITDLTMPYMSGLDLGKKLKEKSINIPTILLTGYGADINDSKRLKSGINSIIYKPVSANELVKEIQDVL